MAHSFRARLAQAACIPRGYPSLDAEVGARTGQSLTRFPINVIRACAPSPVPTGGTGSCTTNPRHLV
eukprot:69496-Prymnesium_polylepis.1